MRVYVSREELLAWRVTPQGFVLAVGMWPFVSCDADGQRQEVWPHVEELFMKRLHKPSVSDARFVVADGPFSRRHPSLYGFLSDQKYDEADGGGDRVPGSLSIWASDGLYRAKLNDKDGGACCYVAGGSWDELMAACDAACSDPSAGWRPDPGAAQKGRKK